MDLPLLLGIFPQVLLDGIILGFMYALIALGYTMVYGVLEFINFAHSESSWWEPSSAWRSSSGSRAPACWKGLPWLYGPCSSSSWRA